MFNVNQKAVPRRYRDTGIVDVGHRPAVLSRSDYYITETTVCANQEQQRGICPYVGHYSKFVSELPNSNLRYDSVLSKSNSILNLLSGRIVPIKTCIICQCEVFLCFFFVDSQGLVLCSWYLYLFLFITHSVFELYSGRMNN